MCDLFAPLPPLPKSSSAQQILIDAAQPVLDEWLYKMLFDENASNFELVVTADADARVHLAVGGRFSLGYLPLARFPSLDFEGETPTLIKLFLAPTFNLLTAVVRTANITTVCKSDGTQEMHAPGALVLAFRTGQLSRARLEIEALARAHARASAIADRVSGVISLAQTIWKEAILPLEAKLGALAKEVDAESGLVSDAPCSLVRELITLHAFGVPSAALHASLVRDFRDAELMRYLKAMNTAKDALVQLCVTQLNPALEMLIHLMGQLFGLSGWPHHFAVTLGLQPQRVSAVIAAAEGMRSAAELLLVSVRSISGGLSSFLCWLIRTVRRLRDESPPSAEEVALPDNDTIMSYLFAADSANCALVDAVGDLLSDVDDGPIVSQTMIERDILDEVSGLPPVRRLPQVEKELTRSIGECFELVANHVSAGFQLYSCTPIDEMLQSSSAVKSEALCTIDALHAPQSPTTAMRHAEPIQAPLVIVAIVDTEADVHAIFFRSAWTLNEAEPPEWAACAVSLPLGRPCSALLYQRDTERVLFLHPSTDGGTMLSLSEYNELPFVALDFNADASKSLVTRVLKRVSDGEMSVHTLHTMKSRRFDSPPANLALSHRRGLASFVSTTGLVHLLDLEESCDESDDDEEDADAVDTFAKAGETIVESQYSAPARVLDDVCGHSEDDSGSGDSDMAIE